MLIQKIKITVFLLIINLCFLQSVFAKEIIVPLKDLAFQNPILRSIESEYNVKVPIPNRFIIKNMVLHLELEKSPALVKERSYFALFWNNKLIYQKPYDPLIDIVNINIELPVDNIKRFNDLILRTVQHYCINCCEFEGSPELWSKIDLNNSYIKITYDEKPILEDTLLIRDYILDINNFNPVHYGVMLENTDSEYLTMASKLASYVGSFIKYRQLFFSYFQILPTDRDTFIIGTKSYIQKLLNLQTVNFPDIYLIPNPNDITKGIVLISGNTTQDVKKNLENFIKIKNELYTGKFYQLNTKDTLDLNFEPFEGMNVAPFNKEVYFSDLGYGDFKVSGIFPPPAEIKFNLPVGLFLEGKKYVIFHFVYNYGAGTREDSVINIYLNDKYVTSLKMDKKYGVVFKEEDIKIPVYFLISGENILKIEYAMMPPGGGFCIAPNLYTLRGTIFAKRSYIKIPKMPFWFEMPYLEYFVSQGFPYSISMDGKDTGIYISELNNQNISSMLTLSAYLGTKIKFPFYNVKVSTDLSQIKDRNIIAIGGNIPVDLYKNSNIKIDSNIDLKFSILKAIKDGLSKFKGEGEKDRLFLKLNYQNALTNQIFFIMAQSPFNDEKTVTIITSQNPEYLYFGVKSLFYPKFAGTIKGDVTIWDFYINEYFNDKINPTYYIGHLPLFDKILYEIGYSPTKFIIILLLTIAVLSFAVKKLLDKREKRRLEGEI